MPNRIPNPSSPSEVRQAFQRLNDSTSVLLDGALGEILVGAGADVAPTWTTELTTLTLLTVDNITINGATIISDTGAISFVNENLTTTGTIDGVNVTSGADPGHTHTGASLSAIDISDDTNLAVTSPIVLTDDTLSLDQSAIDHGTIGGLGDDDHTQYHTDARAVTWLAANHETTYNHANYDTAYGWGDHSLVGYLTAESDTLDDVTGRGATTANAVTVGSLTDSALTSGRIPYASTAGLLADAAGLTYDGTTFFTTSFNYGPDADNFLTLSDNYYAPPSATSYTNSGGTGDRTALISASSTITFTFGAVSNLIDGNSSTDPAVWFATPQSTAGLYMRFDFSTARLIDEATWTVQYPLGGRTHGYWKWQGSNNATDWTDIGSSFELVASTDESPQTHTELNGNVNLYRYYQLIGVSGVFSGACYLLELTFKIDAGDVAYWIPGIQAYYDDGVTVQNLCLEPAGGNVGIAITQPTARLHLPAGTAAASSAPLKLNTGTSLTTAEAGAFEFTDDDLYFTITTGAARKEIALTEGLSSGRVPFATTNGRLTDAAGLAWNGSLLVATGFSGGGVTTGEDPGHTHTGASLSDIDIAEAEATENIAAGLPVYGVAGSATAGLARADTTAKSRVVGLAIAAAASGHTVTYAFGGMLELADWTAVGGSAALTVNSIYYLAETGGITKTPISTTGQYLVELGIAVETTVLLLNIKRPIYL